MKPIKPLCVFALLLGGAATLAQVPSQTLPNPAQNGALLAPTAWFAPSAADLQAARPGAERAGGNLKLQRLEALAARGNTAAMLAIAQLYANAGLGRREYPTAALWLKRVLALGPSVGPDYYEAEARYARQMLLGRGLVPDPAFALQMAGDAATNGQRASAMATLSLASLLGFGVTKDPSAARAWADASLNAGGDPFAHTLLGVFALEGWGEPQDFGAAMAEFQAGAAQNDSDAEVKIGEMYMCGIGAPADYEQARAWLLKAVQQDNPLGFFAMAELRSRGWGSPKNFQGALGFYQPAADAGLPWAEGEVAAYYYLGLGVRKDWRKAALWAKRAAAHGDRQTIQWLVPRMARHGLHVTAP